MPRFNCGEMNSGLDESGQGLALCSTIDTISLKASRETSISFSNQEPNPWPP